MPESLAAISPRSFPVTVLVEYQVVHDNRWVDGRWVVSGVVAAEHSGLTVCGIPFATAAAGLV